MGQGQFANSLLIERVKYSAMNLLFSSNCRTSVYCAVSPKVEGVSGKYFSNEREARPKPYAVDEKTAEALWAYSEDLVKEY